MSDKVAIQAALKLRKAHAEAARLQVLEEQIQLERAAAREKQTADNRNNAVLMWHDAVGERLAQPLFVKLAAKWLVDCEQRLAGAKLDHSIAHKRRGAAADGYAAAQAKVMATESMEAGLAHKSRSREAERQMSLVEDLMLARRAR